MPGDRSALAVRLLAVLATAMPFVAPAAESVVAASEWDRVYPGLVVTIITTPSDLDVLLMDLPAVLPFLLATIFLSEPAGARHAVHRAAAAILFTAALSAQTASVACYGVALAATLAAGKARPSGRLPGRADWALWPAALATAFLPFFDQGTGEPALAPYQGFTGQEAATLVVVLLGPVAMASIPTRSPAVTGAGGALLALASFSAALSCLPRWAPDAIVWPGVAAAGLVILTRARLPRIARPAPDVMLLAGGVAVLLLLWLAL
ncbi:hypothetical protein ACIBH1_34510 [Nonomuraea sp. NPDC050663]|uniref:hypothetical protein n=1 Tax=Nonomuraea sp. NPDC050663 TaxID=3364370 RepID=UPI00378FEB54